MARDRIRERNPLPALCFPIPCPQGAQFPEVPLAAPNTRSSVAVQAPHRGDALKGTALTSSLPTAAA